MVQLISILFLVFSSTAMAQLFTHQLHGNFTVVAAQGPVKFVMEWGEKDGKLSGLYRDNFYLKSTDPALSVTGSFNRYGRNFLVTFPKITKGVQSISLLTSTVKDPKTTKQLPVSIIIRDAQGNPLETTKLSAAFALVKPVVAQRAKERPDSGCEVNFGDLKGYCGRYTGLIAEEVDVTNSCNLLSEDNVSLVLNNERNLFLNFSFIDPNVSSPVHRLGRIRANPESMIDVTERMCGPLAGTQLPTGKDSCKRLNMNGSYSMERGKHHFNGTYTIYDEQTKRVCRYGLSLDKDEVN